MSTINRAIIIGNVGKDPEIRTTQDGKEIASLAVATSESWKDKSTGERKEKTDWHNVVIFNDGLVGVCRDYVRKGMKVYIEGKIQTRKWTDNQGHERYITEIVLQGFNGSLVMLSDKKQSNEPEYTAKEYAKASGGSVLDDEIPF